MASDAEGWALASLAQGDAPRYGVYHYAGGAWTLHSTFSGGQFADFSALAMTSPTEGWALGEQIVADAHGITAHVPLQQVLMHYAAGRWSATVPSISGLPYTTLQRFVVRSPTDIWIVGSQQATYPGSTTSNYQQQTVLLHYDGVRWTQAPAPDMGGPVVAVTGMAFAGDGSGWACGYVSDIPAPQVVQDTDVLARASPLLWSYRDGAWSFVQAG
jgi:hypothetical protein